MIDVVLGLFGFFIFLIIQSLAINGWHECFTFNCVQDLVKGELCHGNIFFKLFPKFIKDNKHKTWSKPIFGCVKCESFVIGSITFWGAVLPLFGFHYYELIVWVFDMFALVTLNWIIYKKL